MNIKQDDKWQHESVQKWYEKNNTENDSPND